MSEGLRQPLYGFSSLARFSFLGIEIKFTSRYMDQFEASPKDVRGKGHCGEYVIRRITPLSDTYQEISLKTGGRDSSRGAEARTKYASVSSTTPLKISNLRHLDPFSHS